MAAVENNTASAYKAGFLGRVKSARELRFETQEAAAVALGMPQSKYSKYEKRSLLPHLMILQFCKVCGVSVQWLIADEGAGPKWEPVYPSFKTRKKRQKKFKRAA